MGIETITVVVQRMQQREAARDSLDGRWRLRKKVVVYGGLPCVLRRIRLGECNKTSHQKLIIVVQ